jgi:hypothetical protein
MAHIFEMVENAFSRIEERIDALRKDVNVHGKHLAYQNTLNEIKIKADIFVALCNSMMSYDGTGNEYFEENAKLSNSIYCLLYKDED